MEGINEEYTTYNNSPFILIYSFRKFLDLWSFEDPEILI